MYIYIIIYDKEPVSLYDMLLLSDDEELENKVLINGLEVLL